MEMKKKIAVAVAAVLSVVASAKDATDGLVGWWRVEKGENGAVLQASDLRDHVHAGRFAVGVNYADADANENYEAFPVCHTNIDLVYPVGSGLLQDEPCMFIPQPTNISVITGNPVVNNQNVVLPLNDVDFAVSPVTFMIRFKVLRYIYGSRATPTVFSYDWSSATGIRFALRGQGSVRSTYPYVYFGETPVLTPGDITILAGEDIWYDVGIVVEPNVPEKGRSRVTVYVCNGNGLTNTSGGGNKIVTSTNITDTVPSFGDISNRRLRIGSTAGSGSWGGLNSNESMPPMLVHQVKVYDRALSVQEFEQACAPYSDPLFTVGSKNGSTDEFSDEKPEAVYVPFKMPWWKLRKTLTSENPSLSIKTSLTAADLDVSRILEFTPFYSDGCPDNANIEVLLNGTVVAKVERNADADRLVHINGKTIARLVNLTDGEYPLTLTLKRVDGMAGSVSFDRISLGGGWQLGIRDDWYGDFRIWNNSTLYNFYRYYLARQNIKLFAGQMYGPDQNGGRSAKQTLCFSVSEALAAKGAFVLKTRPLADGTVEYYLNGEKFSTETVTILTDYEVEIPNGMLKGGINELMAYWITSAGKNSTGFDYIRLTPKRFPRGSIYLIR